MQYRVFDARLLNIGWGTRGTNGIKQDGDARLENIAEVQQTVFIKIGTTLKNIVVFLNNLHKIFVSLGRKFIHPHYF
jgi:hypothetical protein